MTARTCHHDTTWSHVDGQTICDRRHVRCRWSFQLRYPVISTTVVTPKTTIGNCPVILKISIPTKLRISAPRRIGPQFETRLIPQEETFPITVLTR